MGALKTYEDDEQEALFEWAEIQEKRYPILELMHHVPNGGKRDITTARKLKRRGVKPGVPDIFLPVARSGYHGLYIELKVGSNKPTENQQWWLCKLAEQGYMTAVCYSWTDAAEVIKRYIGGKTHESNPTRHEASR